MHVNGCNSVAAYWIRKKPAVRCKAHECILYPLPMRLSSSGSFLFVSQIHTCFSQRCLIYSDRRIIVNQPAFVKYKGKLREKRWHKACESYKS